jgi:hypothetical protein
MDSTNFWKCSSLFLVHRTLASGAPDASSQSIGRWLRVRWIHRAATSLEPSIGRSGDVAPNAEVVLFMRPVATWRQQLLRTLVCTGRSGIRWPTVGCVRWAKIVSGCLLECIKRLASDAEWWASNAFGARWNDRWTLNARDTWWDLVHRTLLSASDAYVSERLCNTLGVCHQLSNGFELKHDRLSGDDDGKVNLWRWA